eukprot:TRINITY_DN1354_c0_g3_i1.p1 TRINITY_DN1354_c0_g3~~TRINITY_DN1354_c0_g3_i1.p1  ORF type:complete len:294 (+),score=55.86 TRINITY_DN1354_c0_g3_i1:131-1012(+)
MGASVCNNCRENEVNKELVTLQNGKPLNLLKHTEQSQTTSTNKLPEDFWLIVKNQLEYGNNPQVKEVEAGCGPFQYDPRIINDGIPTVTVSPLKLSNDALYYGQWYTSPQRRNPAKEERHGFGIIVWKDGSKYIGYWVHDKASIKGRLIHSDGDVYEGEWKDDMACGKGRLVNSSGMEYEGMWMNDLQHGKGVERWTDGAVYEGDYVEGKKSGRGKFVWSDGTTYEGQFHNNAIEGTGTYIWRSGQKYIGSWKDSKMNGQGLLTLPDGSSYSGNFLNDKKDGFGVLIEYNSIS